MTIIRWSASERARDEAAVAAAGLSIRQRKLLAALTQPVTAEELATQSGLPLPEVEVALRRFATHRLANTDDIAQTTLLSARPTTFSAGVSSVSKSSPLSANTVGRASPSTAPIAAASPRTVAPILASAPSAATTTRIDSPSVTPSAASVAAPSLAADISLQRSAPIRGKAVPANNRTPLFAAGAGALLLLGLVGWWMSREPSPATGVTTPGNTPSNSSAGAAPTASPAQSSQPAAPSANATTPTAAGSPVPESAAASTTISAAKLTPAEAAKAAREEAARDAAAKRAQAATAAAAAQPNANTRLQPATGAPAAATTPTPTIVAPPIATATTPAPSAAAPVATAPAPVAPPPTAPAPAPVATAPAPAPAATSAARPAAPAAAAPREGRLIDRVEPVFPRNAEVDNGTVRARLNVSATGVVTGVEILSAEPPRVFDRNVRAALQQWRYEATGEAGTRLVEISFKR